jgi:hypothetical protein
LNITGGLCSWLACSLIKLEVSGSITSIYIHAGASALVVALFTLSRPLQI